MKKYRKIFIVLSVLLAVIIILGIVLFYGNVKKQSDIYIPTGATYEQVLDTLKPHLKDVSSFNFIAKKRGYPELIKPGKYTLLEGENNYSIVHKLRSGDQTNQTVIVKSYWSVYDMAGKVSKFFESDSTALIQAIEKRAKEKGLSEVDAYKVYIFPDTYSSIFFWSDKPEKFLDFMEEEYDKFWTEERDTKAKAQNMDRLQVNTLASIVQRETIKSDEQPIVAGLYLNRLNRKPTPMKLEADPTLVYLKQKENNYNATIKRVYNEDMKIDSPYNTYTHTGLPPLPICIPYKGAIDAVLNPDQNDYIFMCAQPGGTGYHNFSDSYEVHKKNAAEYRAWLDSKNIK